MTARALVQVLSQTDKDEALDVLWKSAGWPLLGAACSVSLAKVPWMDWSAVSSSQSARCRKLGAVMTVCTGCINHVSRSRHRRRVYDDVIALTALAQARAMSVVEHQGAQCVSRLMCCATANGRPYG